jgi:ribosome-associated protein
LNVNLEKPERESKSERKRNMLALQKLGEKLVALSPEQLSKLPLDNTLKTAIHEAHGITSHEAKRRQLQYIGRLMRHIDAEPIQAALQDLALQSNLSKAKFHQMERWRTLFISEEDVALQQFLEQYPHTDRQQLRQLVRNAKKAIPGADTALFRLIRKIIEEAT